VAGRGAGEIPRSLSGVLAKCRESIAVAWADRGGRPLRLGMCPDDICWPCGLFECCGKAVWSFRMLWQVNSEDIGQSGRESEL